MGRNCSACHSHSLSSAGHRGLKQEWPKSLKRKNLGYWMTVLSPIKQLIEQPVWPWQWNIRVCLHGT